MNKTLGFLFAFTLAIVSLPAAAAASSSPCVAPVHELALHEVSEEPVKPALEQAHEGQTLRPLSLAEVRPRTSRERHTLKSSIGIAAVYATAYAIMWNLPEEMTNWEKEEMWDRFLDGLSRGPVWDDDEFVTDWVLHPWWGMWVYSTQRNYGESILRSFLVATAHSVLFEYGIEAWTERPSIQDLLSTSPIGSLMGELVHRWIQRAGRDGFSRGERLLIDLLNPAYRWQIGFDRPVR